MNTFPGSETNGEHDNLPSKSREYMEDAPGCNVLRQQRVNQRNKMKLTEAISLGELIRPFHLSAFFNLGEQRVAALERQT